ncbi:hypothetical protein HYV87_05520 [Candidatus Woesearchaeota archaeon]|nr:hypothetical protein [Candidatus Woesearchaeota archaeon]MBI2582555.1 hypothetical protein [Candidatus Woesearchaeota archaeon]
MTKTEKLFSKVMIVIFLVLLVLGFVVPGVVNYSADDDTTAVEPRLCSSDADCYLLCDNQPVSVLCSQNLCLQNSCDEQSYYSYDAEPITFTLRIQNVSLQERSNGQDLFVKFKGQMVEIHTSRLILYQVLEKVDITLDNQCLFLDGKQYCEEKLRMAVNGENSTQYGSYMPQEEDTIVIEYQ